MEDPRACGDDGETTNLEETKNGRSPRVRGRPPTRHSRLPGQGKIPARAGTTPSLVRITFSTCGRSPRVRGRRSPCLVVRPNSRKIPARAGTTYPSGGGGGGSGEDPRACGDDCLRPGPDRPAGGRSPRVRGRPCGETQVSEQHRKIPARAGTTVSSTRYGTSVGEDPRACGDDPFGQACGDLRGGRSPRVRGRHASREPRVSGEWKIPARAGTTPVAHVCIGVEREDPRACGDDSICHCCPSASKGRSPRVRGRRPGEGI